MPSQSIIHGLLLSIISDFDFLLFFYVKCIGGVLAFGFNVWFGLFLWSETGYKGGKGNLWRVAQEKISNPWGLQMGGRMMPMVPQRPWLSPLVVWKLGHLILSLMPNAIRRLFLDGSLNFSHLLVLIHICYVQSICPLKWW